MFSQALTKLSIHIAASPLTPQVPNDLKGTPTSLGGAASSITNLLLYVVGVASIIMVVVGGFQYVISAGNPERSKTARSTIISAVIGLVITLLAYAIVHFVIGAV